MEPRCPTAARLVGYSCPIALMRDSQFRHDGPEPAKAGVANRSARDIQFLKTPQRFEAHHARVSYFRAAKVEPFELRKTLEMAQSGVSDRGLAKVEILESIEKGKIRHSGVADSGLAKVQVMQIAQLRELSKAGVCNTRLRQR